ncbi:MAG: nickel insertion protein [Thermomicrobiales bacterium]
MKKLRPGTVVSLLAPAKLRAELSDVILRNSTSLASGPSQSIVVKADRSFRTVARFGEVSLKLKVVDDRVSNAMPEYDDCARLAREHGVPFRRRLGRGAPHW